MAADTAALKDSEDTLPGTLSMTAAAALTVALLAACGEADAARDGSPSSAEASPEEDGRRIMQGVILREQASRPGADATAECSTNDLREVMSSQWAAEDVQYLGGYLTSDAGRTAWSSENNGSGRLPDPPPEAVAMALCWFKGSFTVPEAGTSLTETHIVVERRNGGEAITLAAASPEPIGLLAPPVPAGDVTPVTHPQPAGVRVVDGEAATAEGAEPAGTITVVPSPSG